MMSKATIPADVLIFTNGTVIDGKGADPIYGGTVVLHTDCILAVGQASGSDISPDARVRLPPSRDPSRGPEPHGSDPVD